MAAGWDQAGYDSGLTSDNPVENTLTPAKARTLAKKFVFNPGAGTSGAFARLGRMTAWRTWHPPRAR